MKRDPLLKFAAEKLAAGSPGGRALYLASFPFGKLQLWTLLLQEDWQALMDLRGNGLLGRNFLNVEHPSMKGWVYYDQALDAFYHGNLR